MVEIKVNVQLDLSEKTIETLKGIFIPMPMYSPIACGCNTLTGTTVEEQAKKPEPEPAAAPAQKPESAAAPAPKPAVNASSVGIEDVRKVLALKVNDHRDVIKEKLNELGAPSVTKLAKEMYQEMYDFLISL